MKLPERNTVFSLEHNGKAIRTIVDNVQPDPKSSRWWLITVVLGSSDASVFRKGDECSWIIPEGRIPARVQHVAAEGTTKIVLRMGG